MELGGLQKLTLIDFPGKMACTVFTIGCNFRCPFCHNKELVLPEEIINHKRISQQDFFDFLGLRKGLLEGVCITGGEPLIHNDLPDLIKEIRQKGYLVKLDTNGFCPEPLEKLIEKDLLDYIAMDIKAPLIERKYNKACGLEIDLVKIKKSIYLIKNSGIEHEFRTTVLPALHSKEDIVSIAQAIKGANAYYLQSFRPGKTINESYSNLKPFVKEDLELIAKECNKHVATKIR